MEMAIRSVPAFFLFLTLTRFSEPVWPSSKATSVRICFGSPFASKFVLCGHCLVTLISLMVSVDVKHHVYLQDLDFIIIMGT